MTTQTLRPAFVRHSPARQARPTTSDDAHITHLTPDEISRMSNSQLVDIIRAERLPVLRDEALASMAGYDRQTLERLVYLTQRCCRNRCGEAIL